jgi:hypothetical protein
LENKTSSTHPCLTYLKVQIQATRVLFLADNPLNAYPCLNPFLNPDPRYSII